MPTRSRRKLRSTRKLKRLGAYAIGINYEGGKIIEHILEFDQCIAYANCQIAMDAPYHKRPRVANAKLRGKGRSETFYNGYNERRLQNKLEELFILISERFPDTRIVIQIARGKSAEPTYVDVLKPVIDKVGIEDIITQYGYRSADYYTPTDNTPFVFINYGMFAELSENVPIKVGDLCNPVISYEVTGYDDEFGFTFGHKVSFEKDPRNLLNEMKGVPKLSLFGIADEMEFITPDVYKKEHVLYIRNSI